MNIEQIIKAVLWYLSAYNDGYHLVADIFFQMHQRSRFRLRQFCSCTYVSIDIKMSFIGKSCKAQLPELQSQVSDWHPGAIILAPINCYTGAAICLSVLMIYVHLKRFQIERFGPSQTDWLALSKYSTVFDDHGRPDFSCNVAPVSLNFFTYFRIKKMLGTSFR